MDKPFPPEAVVLSRRQSFAKYHAMLIEAPVTKVVKLLMATKENSAPPVSQALEGVLDILRATDLYNPQLAAGQEKTEDQMTSDLVAGLTGVGILLGVLLPVYALASGDLLSTQLAYNREVISRLCIQIMQTLFQPLIWLGLSIFVKMNVPTSIEIDDSTIRNWLQLIESHYQDNPYHNSTHAADVMQATAYFLLRLRKKVRGHFI
ncbi:hypothetical protein HPB52_020114 [Rhipicephalus sanguineus]|uniref:PDEase domain-containing protein n=1 Tax=Rhipicephalus sanguineus TaxID=34632 RepID=A0A9D4Q2P9_RHISA|nr:hypothetical protein HPB52_020114 [Rhipicephalus sanguineus]